MDCCPQQPLKQHVARAGVEIISRWHAILELNADVHPELSCAGGCTRAKFDCTAPVMSTVSAPRACALAEVEPELAHLVAARGEPRAVVALDPQLDPKGRTEVRRRIERCRRVTEPDSREPGDGGERAGRDAGGLGRTRT